MNTITQIKNVLTIAKVIVKTTKWRMVAAAYLVLFLTVIESPALALLVWIAGGLLDLTIAGYIAEKFNVSIEEIQHRTA